MKARKLDFTLLELMIAVTIFMLVAVALFSFSTDVTNSWTRISTERNRFNELLVLDRAIETILTNAVPFMWREDDRGDKNQAPFFLGTQNVLRIAYLHKLNNPVEGAIRFAEIQVQDGQLQAAFTDRPFMNWNEIAPEKCTVSILAQDVESVSFQYVDWHRDFTEDWKNRMFMTDVWDEDETGREDIPLGISVQVNWKDGRSESWFRRTMGNSFRERYGTYELPMDN